MATARSTIELVISGITRGLGAAATEAEAAASRVAAAEDRVSAARARSEDADARLGLAEQRLENARSAQGAASQRVADQETRINDARARSEHAAGLLENAERHLDTVRQGGGSSEAIAAAEERVSRARRDAEAETGLLGAAEQRLGDLRRRQAEATTRVAAAEDNVRRARRDGEAGSRALAEAEAELTRRRGELDQADRRGSPFRSFFAGIAEGINPLSAFGTLIGDVGTRMGGFGQALSGIAGPIGQFVLGLLQVVAVANGLGVIIGLLGGLVGQALSVAPALLTLGAAAGTVVLGMKGIEAAAKVVEPALNRLKADVSTVFQQSLTPAFRDLAALLPKLSDGFQIIAVSISQVISNLVRVGTSVTGVQQLQTVLKSAGNLVLGLGDGITRLFSGLLAGAAALAPQMQAFGAAIGDIFGKIGDAFARAADTGVLQAAFTGLISVIQGLADVIGPLITLFLDMGAALGTSVGGALSSVGAAITAVTPFFTELARVAGVVLRDAFAQLGPPLHELFDAVFPAAKTQMSGFAAVMHDVVLPAVAGFINWLRTDGIPGFLAFTSACVDAALTFASTVLGVFSSILRSVGLMLAAVASIPSPWARDFGKAAAATLDSANQVDHLRGSIDLLHPKVVDAIAHALGKPEVDALAASINALRDRTITISTNVVGGINKILGFAGGGRVPVGVPFLVGERGPELMQLDGQGGVVSSNPQTRKSLSAVNGANSVISSAGSGSDPITVNVSISQDAIAGIAQVEIVRSNRATKRTVLAGSGATF